VLSAGYASVFSAHTIVGFKFKLIESIVATVTDLRIRAVSGKEAEVNTIFQKVYITLQDLASREDGQDLVEYALVVALIAFGATSGMKAVATGLNHAFSNISSNLGSYVA